MSVLTNEFECINEVLRDNFHWQKITHSDSMKFISDETDRILAVVVCWAGTHYYAYIYPIAEESQPFNTQQDAMNYVEILAMLGDI